MHRAAIASVASASIVPALSPVQAHYESIAGRIEAKWSVSGDNVTYEITVPAEAQGQLVLSSGYREARVDGTAISDDGTPVTLTPGRHVVTFEIETSGGTLS